MGSNGQRLVQRGYPVVVVLLMSGWGCGGKTNPEGTMISGPGTTAGTGGNDSSCGGADCGGANFGGAGPGGVATGGSASNSSTAGGAAGSAGGSGGALGTGGNPTCTTTDCVCPEGAMQCGEVCAVLSSDSEHCGACDTKCLDLANTQDSCVDSSCVCAVGYADCDTEPGCELAVTANHQNCGGCGIVCADQVNSTLICADGKCGCMQDFNDCDAELGCESAWATDAANCGECGNMCASGTCIAGECTRRVFVTSEVYTGDLGPLEDSDAKCQALADAAGLGGTYVAWLSDSTTDAKDRVTQGVPLVRVDGVFLSPSIAEMLPMTTLDITMEASILLHEDGTEVPVDTRVRTGSAEGGTSAGSGMFAYNCLDWTNETNAYLQYVGRADVADYRWTHDGGFSCSEPLPMFCFEL